MPTLPLNLFGAKTFYGLKRPDYWCPESLKNENRKKFAWPVRPDGITSYECLMHEYRVGDLIWIPVETPHWVDAGSYSATITFTFPNMQLA